MRFALTIVVAILAVSAGPAMAGRDQQSFWADLAFYDDFARADGSLGKAPTGQTWREVSPTAQAGGPRVLPFISGQALVAPDAPVSDINPTGITASYAAIDLGHDVSKVRARISFGPGAGNGNVTTIITRSVSTGGISHIVRDGAIHITWTVDGATIGFFDNGRIDYLYGYNYDNMATDGTQYDIGFDLHGDTVLFHGPDGTVTIRTDPRFETYLGRYVTFEHNWSALPDQSARSTIHRAGAD
jgi:hypothetical protein